MTGHLRFQSAKWGPIRISVPDVNRASCYAPFLEELLSILGDYFRKEGGGLRYHLGFGAQSGDDFKPSQLAIKGILTHMAHILDQQVIHFISYDLRHYRHEKYGIPLTATAKEMKKRLEAIAVEACFSVTEKENEEEIKRLASEHVQTLVQFYQKELKQYYEARGDLLSYFKQHYPLMIDSLRQIPGFCAENIIIMLNRIRRDETLLKQTLLQGMKKPKLSNIKSSGSDFHRQGKQVYFLYFKDEAGEERKVIYKPSPLQADAMVMGNMAALAAVDERYKGSQSLAEIFNESAVFPIPTYWVLLRMDESEWDDIDNYYGYVEFLEHDEGLDFNLGDDHARERYFYSLQEMAKKGDCSSILRTEEEKQRFSYVMGIDTALLQFISAADMHQENMIVSRKLPVFFDFECIFNPVIPPTCDGSSLLSFMQGISGAISPIATTGESESHLNDILGETSSERELPAKNRVFHLDEEKEELISYGVDETYFMQGYDDGLSVIAANKKALQWFDQDIVKAMFVRYVPAATFYLQKLNQRFCQENFSSACFQEAARVNLEKGLIQYKRRMILYRMTLEGLTVAEDNADQNQTIINALLPAMPLPNEVIFSQENNDEDQLLNEALAGSTPYYYMRVNSRRLFDFNSSSVHLSRDFLGIREEILSELTRKEGEAPYLEADFFVHSPREFTLARAEKLANDRKVQQAIREDTRSQIESLQRTLAYYFSVEFEDVVKVSVSPSAVYSQQI